MSCNNCGSTSPCGCKDHALTTPCGYTDCTVGHERCDDIQCAECVSYCGTSFQVVVPGEGDLILKVEQGERLDSIIQKFALMIANGLGVCTADNLHHAPYNLYMANITATSADVVWTGVSSLTVGLNIFYNIEGSVNPDIQANALIISPSVDTYSILNLTPATDYILYIESVDAFSNECNSVTLLFSTPAT
jgi:hypothetical protein